MSSKLKIGLDTDLEIVLGVGNKRFGLADTQAMALAQATIASLGLRHLTHDLDCPHKAHLLAILDGSTPVRPSFIEPETWLLILLCLLPLQHGHGPNATLSHAIATQYKAVNHRCFHRQYLDLCTYLGTLAAQILPAPTAPQRPTN